MGAEVSVTQNPRGAGGPGSGHFPCFDGIRAIAALMVVVYHAVFFATWFKTPGGIFLWNLNAGVWVFFVASGFLLYRPFAVAHMGGPTVSTFGYGARRAARIYPAYWLVLAFFTFVVPRAVIHGADGFVRHVTLTQTYVHVTNPFLPGLPPAWSLVVEVTFYVFLPLYAFATGRLARTRRAIAVELGGAAALVALGVVAIVAVGSGYDAPWIAVLPQHLAAFGIGIGLAVVSLADPGPRVTSMLEWAGRTSWLWWGCAAAAFAAIPLVAAVRPLTAMSTAQTIALNLLQTIFGFFVVVPAVFGPQDRGVIRRLLRTRLLTFLGAISYGLYLWHWFVLRIVQEDWLGWPLQRGNWVAVLVLALPIVIVAAAASWFGLERPILQAARSCRPRDLERP